MEFILFQQGEGEEIIDKSGQSKMVLSKKGAKAVANSSRALTRLIPRKVKVQVWSSISPIASETAELIAEELGVKRKLLRNLETEDITSILNTAVQYGGNDNIVIVSTQDHLQAWVQHLVGIQLPFAEASASGLSINLSDPQKSDLLWFLHSKYLRNIN